MTGATDTLIQTPGTTRVRDLMEQALTSLDPMEFRFTVARYGSLQGAKSKAVSFRNQFHSIRARARNSAHVQMGRKHTEFTGEQLTGRYDKLAATTEVLPDGTGYAIVISTTVMEEFEVYNARTGERILTEDISQKRFNTLLALFVKRAFDEAWKPPYLSPTEEREFWTLNPDVARITHEDCGVRIPPWVDGMASLVAESHDFDLVDTAMDDFGVGPEEAEGKG